MPSGILVHGSNHLIVSGPLPTIDQARRLAKEWEMPEIGGVLQFTEWTIKTKEFRENLTWAVVLDNGERQTEAVLILLDELEKRGVTIARGDGLRQIR